MLIRNRWHVVANFENSLEPFVGKVIRVECGMLIGHDLSLVLVLEISIIN